MRNIRSPPIKRKTRYLPIVMPLSKSRKKNTTLKVKRAHIATTKQKFIIQTEQGVTRLFRSLATLFQDKIGGDGEKNLPVIDKRQKREIEEKRNAEISMV